MNKKTKRRKDYNKKHHNKKNYNKKHHNKTRKREKVLKDNFYHYVNNSWITSNYVTKDLQYKTPFTILQKTIDNQLLKCVKNLIKTNKQCKALFISSVNWNDALVENQTYLYIKQINEFRKDEKGLYPFLKWSLYNGFVTPIDLIVLHDVKKEGHYLATITENGLAFNVKDIYFKKEKEYANTREYYCKFIQEVFNLFFGKNNEYCAEHVLEVECELAKHMFSIAETDSVEKTYNKMSLKKAKDSYHFDAKQFLKEFGIIGSGSLDINLLNPEYVKNAMITMHGGWTSVKWNSYWVFKLLMSMASFHSKMYAFVFEFFLVKIRGANPKMLKREMIATYNMCTIMNSTVSREYIKHFKNTKEIEYVTDMIERIKRTFKERITKNEWLSQETKERALIKIDKMIQAIGYREKMDPDPQCNFFEYDAFGNNVKFINWHFDQYKTKLAKPKGEDLNRWKNMDEMNVFTVNAYYNNTKNEIILPNAILQKPFIDITKPLSHNLGFIGFIIGHELVHAFDSQGALYDEKGLLRYWWSKEDRKRYSLLQKDVIEHYEALAKKDGHKLDGKLTLDENIADISALNIIEDTLETYLTEQNIFGEKQTEFFKDLYYNYAKQWRTIIKPKQLKLMLMTDQHSLAKYRVNCVLMRSKRFNRIFNIHNGDDMFYSVNVPEIW
jgi:putative endopeptidase